MTESGHCRGCGKAGQLVFGVCVHSRRAETQPKKTCFERAQAADKAVQGEFHDWLKSRPRSVSQEIVLDRIRSVDTKHMGCFKSMNDLAVGKIRDTIPPNTPKMSQRSCRRATRVLQIRGDIVFAGQVAQGNNIWLNPEKTDYDPKKIPICKFRNVSHLWSVEEAKRLIGGSFEVGEPVIIEKYFVNRKLLKETDPDLLLEAIRCVNKLYPNLPVPAHTAKLQTTIRRIQAGRNAVYAARMSDSRRKQDERQLKKIDEDLQRNRLRMSDEEIETARAELSKLWSPAIVEQMIAQEQQKRAGASSTRPSPSVEPSKPVSPETRPTPPRPASSDAETAPDRFSIRWQIEQFLKAKSVGNKQTFECYTQKCAHLLEPFGDLRGEDITADDLIDYIKARRASNICDSTIRAELDLLFMVHKALRKRDDLAPIRRQIDRKSIKQKRWLEKREYEAVRLHLSAELQDYLDVAVFTGAREGELRALRVEHYDPQHGRLYIPGGKTPKSKRHIPAHEEVKRVFEAARAAGRTFGPLFQLPVKGAVYKQLEKACKLANIPRFSPLDLRHTFISWLVQAGHTSQQIIALTGHTDSKMIDQVYGHFNQASLEPVIASLGKRGPPRASPEESAALQ